MTAWGQSAGFHPLGATSNFAKSKPSANIAIAAVLIAGGGLIAAKDMIWRR